MFLFFLNRYWSIAVLSACWITSVTAQSPATPSPPESTSDEVALAYHAHRGGTIFYSFKITIGAGRESQRYNGTLHYRVDTTDGNNLTLGVIANLNKAFSPATGLRGITALSRGRNHEVNSFMAKIEMDRFGEIKSLSRDHALPALLGSLPLVAVTELPKNETTRQWTQKDVVTISEEKSTDNSLLIRPLYGRNPSRVSGAAETTKFQIDKSEGDLVTVSHKFSLDAKLTETPLELSGSGISVFDKRRGFYTSHAIKRTLSFGGAGGKFTVPVTIDIKSSGDSNLVPMTPEEQAKKAEAQANLNARMAEYQRQREAKEQAKAEEAAKPFTEDELSVFYAALADPSDSLGWSKAMREMEQRSAQNVPKLAAALLAARDKVPIYRRERVLKLAAKYDASLKETVEDIIEYSKGYGEVSRTGRPVPATAALPNGTIVAVKQNNRWESGIVVSKDREGQVFYKTRPDTNSIKQASISDVRYAPATVPQPSGVDPTESAQPTPTGSANKPREWSDVTGKFKVQATYVSVNSEVVTLKRTDGKSMQIPLSKLSEADVKFVDERIAEENSPFKVIE